MELTKDGRMARKAGVCCEAATAAGAAAGQAEASPRTLTPPPHVQLPSAMNNGSFYTIFLKCKVVKTSQFKNK